MTTGQRPHDPIGGPLPLTADLGRRLYTDMWRIRLFEEEALRQTSLGSVKGALHTYCGEEAVAVGVCAHLRDDDYVLGTHRSHGHCLAKGAPRPPRCATWPAARPASPW